MLRIKLYVFSTSFEGRMVSRGTRGIQDGASRRVVGVQGGEVGLFARAFVQFVDCMGRTAYHGFLRVSPGQVGTGRTRPNAE